MNSIILKVSDLKAKVQDKEILKGINLEIKKGEIHVVMGPNGAGKSTLTNTLMGHPNYRITEGSVLFEGKEIRDLRTDERARLGMFLSFQNPEELPGISVENFIRSAKVSIDGAPIKLMAFRKELKAQMEELKIREENTSRSLNVGFSGGEKKKNEILQMKMLKPRFIMLDEADSGLDVDAIRVVAEGVRNYLAPEHALLVITHQRKILEYLKPDFVHVLSDGRIIETGDYSLALEIERNGYERFVHSTRDRGDQLGA